MTRSSLVWPILLLAALSSMAAAPETKTAGASETTAQLEQMTNRFVRTDITADVSKLAPNERRALTKLIQASKIIDGIFLRQAWSDNPSMLLDLARDQTPEGRARLHYFIINRGPWSDLDEHKPFVRGAPPKPPQAGFYPNDATKEEIEQWISSLPADEQAVAKNFFTVIKRNADGKGFQVVPYSVEYQPELLSAAKLLREAADATGDPALKKFLNARATAFLTNDYYDSDVAWMESNGPIQPTIGPYEVYEDRWFNYKASFEAYITLKDEAESAKLQKLSGELQGIEDQLPIDPKYRNPKLGGLAPIVVVNEIFFAGDNHGVQTAAFNLPNDERITRDKGAKRTMLKNVSEAKFAKTLVPISKVVLSSADQKDVNFDAFFSQILVHELMHGLGPHNITVNGRETTVRQEMKEAGSVLEEAKADIASLFAIQLLIDKGVMPKTLERPLYTTYLVSAFRSIRFGLTEAHGQGQAIQLNYLLDAGAFAVKPDGTFAVVPGKIKQGVAGLSHDIMTIQAEGSYDKAREMATRLGVIRPEVQRVLDKLKTVPVDIEPNFLTAEQLLRGSD